MNVYSLAVMPKPLQINHITIITHNIHCSYLWNGHWAPIRGVDIIRICHTYCTGTVIISYQQHEIVPLPGLFISKLSIWYKSKAFGSTTHAHCQIRIYPWSLERNNFHVSCLSSSNPALGDTLYRDSVTKVF